MNANTYTLDELAAASGMEARTIRNYIERGLLPSAQSRGRGASYLPDHLNRLRVIKTLRRASPNLSLAEIRIRLQQLTPEDIRALAEGRIAAVPAASDAETGPEGELPNDDDFDDDDLAEEEADETAVRLELSEGQLAGAQRLVHALRQVTGHVPAAPAPKAEAWQRIAVTEDVELSVRAGFGDVQLAAFRELADLLRVALTRGNVTASVPKSDQNSSEAGP